MKLRITLASACCQTPFVLRVFLLFVFVLGLPHGAQAQVSSYGFSENIVGYTPLGASSTVAYAAPWNNYAGTPAFTPLGFTFVYDGVSYTECFISTNGFITFGATRPAANNVGPLNSTNAYEGAISAMGTNLFSDTGAIRYETLGTAPNRTFVVQWENAVRATQPGALNFQIRLQETTNVIQLVYGFCFPTETTNVGVQVGLRGFNNTFAQGNVKNRLQPGVNALSSWFQKTTDGIANNSTVRTSFADFPDNGLVYTFTPPLPCTTPTGALSNLVVGGTTVTVNSFTGNSFAPGTSNANGYLILRSLVDVPPTAADIQNRVFYTTALPPAGGIYTVISSGTATTFTQTGLTNNTTYYYWVIPYNFNCFGAPFYHLAGMVNTSQTTCIPAPGILAASGVGGNEFTANWTAVAGATGYTLDVATNATFTNLVPGYSNFPVGNVTSFAVTGLNPVTTYYYRVRAVGLGCALVSGSAFASTTCGFYTIPYTQNFDTTPVNGIPSCSVVSDVNADATTWRTQTINVASAPRALYINSTASVMDDWFFTPQLQLNAGVTYRLFFRYNTQRVGATAENLRVRWGTGQSVGDMNITLLDLPNILSTIYQSAVVDFTPITSGLYSIGFQGYSLAGQTSISLDDISVTVAPTCFEPQSFTLDSVGISTASLSWSEPEQIPSVGYAYYLSPSSTPPTGATTPSGTTTGTSVSLTGLTSSTTYYFWVRGECGPGGSSVWSLVQEFSTDCDPPFFVSAPPVTRCGVGTAVLTAVPNAGSTTQWYASAVGGTPLASGTTYTPSSLLTSTTFYAEAVASGGNATLGPASPNAVGGDRSPSTVATFNTIVLNEASTLLSLDIYPISSGQAGTLTVRNSIGQFVASYNFTTNVVGGNTPQTLAMNLPLASGTYNVFLDVVPTSGLITNLENVAYPYTNSVATLSGNGFDNNFYMYFYNWKFTTVCRSARVAIPVTLTPPPALGISTTETTICSGDITAPVLVTGLGAYSTYSWSPATGVGGDAVSGFTFAPNDTTVYTLLATQTFGDLCANIVTFTVNVNVSPPQVFLSPDASTICAESVQLISANLGAASQVPVLNSNFNAGAGGWTTVNESTLGTPAAAAWTIQNSPYTYASGFWNVTMSSPDASPFFLTNSDAQGSAPGVQTRTILESPLFSLDGLSTATLTFRHYLFYIFPNTARVEVSTDAGGSWTTLQSFLTSQGLANSFALATVNMNAYVGQTQMKIRFLFEATWDYGWAIDNVLVAGNPILNVVWTPVDGLYTDAAATIPYVANTPIGQVYAKPLNTTTYTGTVTSVNGCFTLNTATVTIDPQPVGGTLNGDQELCGGVTPSPLELSGSFGTIVRWESADDALFTVNVTPIAVTTATLNSAQMGVFSGVRYFRAVLGNGVCPVVYSTVSAVGYPTTVWNGTAWSNGLPNASRRAVFTASYLSTGDLTACALEMAAGVTVTFQSGHTLTLSNPLLAAGTPGTASLVFENGASLLQDTTLPNTGTIFYRRNSTPMVSYDYTYWSSPVAGQVLGSFSPYTNIGRFYIWNATVYNWQSVAATSTFVAGRGYIIRAPSIAPFNTVTPQVFNGVFRGVPHNGPVTAPVVFSGTNDMNLLGNPYPSAISADAFISHPGHAGVVGGTLYFWTHNTPITNNVYTSNDYAVYNFTGGVGTQAAVSPGANLSVPDGTIAAGQGFFMRALSSGTARFENTMRLAGQNTSFFRTAPAVSSTEGVSKNRLWLELTHDQGAYKQMLVGYLDGATSGFDVLYDGAYVSGSNPVGLYSLLEDTPLSIQGKGLPFAVGDRIPLGMVTSFAGAFRIGLAQFDGLFVNQAVYLEDLHLGLVHDLKQGPYGFTTDSGTFHDRFVLRFQPGTLSLNDVSAAQALVFAQSGDLVVRVQGDALLQDVVVYDLQGRLVARQNGLSHTETRLEQLPLATQLLLVQLTLDSGAVVTQKVLFR